MQAAARSLAALPSDAIVERVRQLIGCSVPYHVITKNCEHYVTEWRFGQAWSDQVSVSRDWLCYQGNQVCDERHPGSRDCYLSSGQMNGAVWP